MALSEVVTLYPSNFRNCVETLRTIADGIENGEYGDVTDFTLVLNGDSLEIFHGGEGDAGTTCLLLNSAILKLVSPIVEKY